MNLKNSMFKEMLSMKPRIFVSSTFYDLKYVREDISNFIKAHDFEPIMFEDGDIGYTPGKPLDESCYESMRSADMVILIIGGNYGSPSSGEEHDEKTEFKNYISVTRKEFKTALDEGIPIYAFIESSVYGEYDIFELNRSSIEQDNSCVKFSATKDINVFYFINEVKSLGNISVTEFRKPSEIKDFLGKQWSDMFKNHLKSLKNQKDYEKTHNSIDELRATIKELQVLVNGLFEKTFNNQIELEYDKVKDEQRKIRAKSISKFILDAIEFTLENDNVYYAIKEILSIIINAYSLNNEREDMPIERMMDDLLQTIYDRIDGIRVYKIKSDIFFSHYIYELIEDEILHSEVIETMLSDYKRYFHKG